MAKKQPVNPEKNKSSADYYKLNTKAVDRLVNADKIELPKDKKLKDPAKKYRSDFLDRIPAWVKAVVLKFWFPAMVCFYIIWGLGQYFIDMIDMLFVVAIALGIITDILTNNALRFVETIPGEYDKWMMFPKKKFWTFFANIIYAFIILNCVVGAYEVINNVIASITKDTETVFVGVEPILFGMFYMLFDLLFIGIKHLIKSIINDAKNKVDNQ